jgi:hypothetical protein
MQNFFISLLRRLSIVQDAESNPCGAMAVNNYYVPSALTISIPAFCIYGFRIVPSVNVDCFPKQD